MNFLESRMVGVLLVGVLFLGGSGCDRSNQGGSKLEQTLIAKDAYMLAIAPGQTRAAVYLTLVNNGEQARAINLISTNVAGYAEVHNHIHADGVMKMRKVNHPTVAANSTLAFNSGGYHIMLFDVSEAPKEGGQFELEMAFDQAESLKVLVDVQSPH